MQVLLEDADIEVLVGDRVLQVAPPTVHEALDAAIESEADVLTP